MDINLGDRMKLRSFVSWFAFGLCVRWLELREREREGLGTGLRKWMKTRSTPKKNAKRRQDNSIVIMSRKSVGFERLATRARLLPSRL